MLRIGVHNEEGSTGLVIEGKLATGGVTELEKCWQSVIAADPVKPVVVNLVRVTFIDSKGKDLLVRMRRQGVNLVPTGCLMKAIVEQIELQIREESPASYTLA
jgi:anti-anti-sigma regulatory factor